jgi:peptide/nickel transport system substrate-binding protein
MGSTPPRGLSRRDLLRYGGQGSFAIILGSALAACGSSGSSPSGSVSSSATSAAGAGAPKRGGTLAFARSVAPTQLNPANSIIAGDVYTLDKIFEPLFITSPAGQLTPWLAQSYTTSADHITWTFQLRPGVTFSDGTPLTADDVVFSIEREAANSSGPLGFLDFAIKKVTAQGTSTVVITLSQPWAPFLSDISVFANAILPKNFGGKSESDFFAHPVGTGPFLLDRWCRTATSPSAAIRSTGRPASRTWMPSSSITSPTTTSGCCSCPAVRPT